MAKSDYLRILIQYNERLYSFININCSQRDGSLNITLRRDGLSSIRASWSNLAGDETPKHIDVGVPQEKNKKITIHQSGRINLPDLRHYPIYIEPLVSISKAFAFCAYRIPRISALSIFSKQVNENDLIIDLSSLPDTPQSFDLVIAPAGFIFNGLIAKVEYLHKFAFCVFYNNPVIPVREGFEEHFITHSIGIGLFKEQQISEDVALIGYHQATQDTREVIFYSPNNEGIWQIVFAVQSRFPPNATIETASDKYIVEVIDQMLDQRVNRATIKFKVKDKKNGQTIRELVTFSRIELNAQI